MLPSASKLGPPSSSTGRRGRHLSPRRRARSRPGRPPRRVQVLAQALDPVEVLLGPGLDAEQLELLLEREDVGAATLVEVRDVLGARGDPGQVLLRADPGIAIAARARGRVRLRLRDPVRQHLVGHLGRDPGETRLALGARDRGIVGQERGDGLVRRVAGRGALEDRADVAKGQVRRCVVVSAATGRRCGRVRRRCGGGRARGGPRVGVALDERLEVRGRVPCDGGRAVPRPVRAARVRARGVRLELRLLAIESRISSAFHGTTLSAPAAGTTRPRRAARAGIRSPRTCCHCRRCHPPSS